jgi:hypothetical protein
MRKFNVSRMPGKGSFSSRLALASGPFAVLLACSVYDGALTDEMSVPGGGTSSGEAGAMTGGAIGQGGSGNDAGASGKPMTQAGSAGEAMGGTTVVGGGAGSAGAQASGSDAGGSAGNATAGGGAGGEPPTAGTVVDDMEDTDAQITVDGGRNGFWYVGNDGTAGGTQTPTSEMFEMFELASGERGDSTYSAHMKVSGFTSWGSVLGFNLVEQQAMLKPYDASAFCGVQFWGKAVAATSLRLRLPDGDTHPAGMVCKETGAANTLCYDHFSAAVALTTAWKSFSVTFASLVQVGGGYHPADNEFRADQLYAMEWALPAAAGKAFEIWIDDVTLVPCK